MVSDAASRAASLALVGGDLALDFTNTVSGRDAAARQENLQTPAHVAAWAGRAGALAPADAGWLAGAATGPLGARLLAGALALREDVYGVGAAVAARRPIPTERVDALSRAHARTLAHARLTPAGAHFVWTWRARETPVEAALGPISLSALTLLQRADLARVKQCPGEGCGWLFFDATRNKSRRWCEMEVCGNRAKQKRFVAARSR